MELKRYSVYEISDQAQCYDCGLPYGSAGWIEAIVPNEIWEIITPSYFKGSGLLCINCISRRCVEAGLENVPVKMCGMEPLIPVIAFPIVARCKLCGEILHVATADLGGLTDFGWRYDEPHGWICTKHSNAET